MTIDVASLKSRLRTIARTGIGFLAVTLAFGIVTAANPLAIWRTNAANHARFSMWNSRGVTRHGSWRIPSNCSWRSAWRRPSGWRSAWLRSQKRLLTPF